MYCVKPCNKGSKEVFTTHLHTIYVERSSPIKSYQSKSGVYLGKTGKTAVYLIKKYLVETFKGNKGKKMRQK